MSRLSTTAENAGIAAIAVPSTTYYLALFTTDPGTTGAGEISGGSYARQVLQFSSASGGSESSTDAQTFTNMPAESGGIPYFGVFSAATGGTYEFGGLTSGLSSAISAGSTVTFAIGAVTASIS